MRTGAGWPASGTQLSGCMIRPVTRAGPAGRRVPVTDHGPSRKSSDPSRRSKDERCLFTCLVMTAVHGLGFGTTRIYLSGFAAKSESVSRNRRWWKASVDTSRLTCADSVRRSHCQARVKNSNCQFVVWNSRLSAKESTLTMMVSFSLQVVAPNQYSYGSGGSRGLSVGSRRVRIALGLFICCAATNANHHHRTSSPRWLQRR
jgi:hypothetical protein